MDAIFSLWGNNSTKVNISYQPPTRLDILPQKSQRTLAFKATSGDNQPCGYKISKITLKSRPNSRKGAARQMRTSLSSPATSIS